MSYFSQVNALHDIKTKAYLNIPLCILKHYTYAGLDPTTFDHVDHLTMLWPKLKCTFIVNLIFSAK